MGKPPRNVLLVTADQWRGDCLSALDHPCIRTPNFDALLADGMAFGNHYSVCAPCGPARASLLTGMYMLNHRSVRNGTPLSDRHTNIAREVRKAGYRPKLFGYTDTSLDPGFYPEDQVRLHGYEGMMPGFEEGLLLPSERPEAWLVYLREQGIAVNNMDEAFAPAADFPGANSRGRTFAPPRFSADQSQTAFLTRAVIDELAEAPAGWFVHLSYFRPHPPFIAPPPFHAMYDPAKVPMPLRADSPAAQAAEHPWLAAALGPLGDWYDRWIQETTGSEGYDHEIHQIRATYYGMISKVDHYFGELMAFLKQSGQLDRTLVIITSDHGELLGDRWLFGKRGYFDEAYRIPLIVHDPRLAQTLRGRVVDAFTESVDIMPTVLEWLGLDVPRQCDGHSLIPWLRGKTPPDWRQEVHWEYDFRDVEDDAIEHELGVAMDHCSLNVIRDRQHKYVHFASALPPLLFDLEKDPAEHRNLAEEPEYAEVVARMAQRMLGWRMSHAERVLTGLSVSREGITKRG